MSDPTTNTSGDPTIRVLGGMVTIAGFVLAWIVWTSAGRITGHTVSMMIPIIERPFSVAFLLPILSEGFVLMSVRISNARETSEKTRAFARRAVFWTIVIMAIVGLIVNTPMAEMRSAQWLVAAIIGCGTPVALYLGWTLRSRYAEDRARYEERQAERQAKRRSATPTATTTATSKPRSATPTATDATASATTTATPAPRSAPEPDDDHTTKDEITPESPSEITAPMDRADCDTTDTPAEASPERSLDSAAPADVEAGIESIERYLDEIAEADGKKAKAADFVRYLVLVQGRDLHEIKGAEIASGAEVSPALGRQVRALFHSGDLTISEADKLRFAGFGNLSQ